MKKTKIDILITQSLEGDSQAQMELYDRYHRAMYNTAYRIIKIAEDAEEAMQEAFITAFEKLSELKEASAFGAWLKRIVVHESIRYYHQNKKNQSIRWDEDIAPHPDAEISEETNINGENTGVDKLNEGLLKLKDNYRVILSLYYVEGYDHDEIGDIMNLSYANSRTMLSRARESLRTKCLQQ